MRANSVDLDEVAHDEPPHQDLRCLQIQLFSSLVVKELKLVNHWHLELKIVYMIIYREYLLTYAVDTLLTPCLHAPLQKKKKKKKKRFGFFVKIHLLDNWKLEL